MHVFISYAREDRGYVETLAAHLQAAGLKVWYDHGIAAGEDFGQEIQEKIQQCYAFVVVLTPTSVASRWVNRELSYADDKNKKIVPLVLKSCEPPIRLVSLHHEDVRGEQVLGEQVIGKLRAAAIGPLNPQVDSADIPDDVWRQTFAHSNALHRTALYGIFDHGRQTLRTHQAGASGVVLIGAVGTGKTYVLSMIRRRVQQQLGGYFFLPGLFSADNAWQDIASGINEGLLRPGFGWPSQLATFLQQTSTELNLESQQRDAICGDLPLTPVVLGQFVDALAAADPTLDAHTLNAARALALGCSRDFVAQDLSYEYLLSLNLSEPSDRRYWGLPAGVRSPKLIVKDVCRLLSRTGPIVIAFDQLTAFYTHSGDDAHRAVDAFTEAIYELCEDTTRNLIVLSCLPQTWDVLAMANGGRLKERFRDSFTIGPLGDEATAREIVLARLQAEWSRRGFTPPHDIWPLTDEMIANASGLPVRRLLELVNQQLRDVASTGSLFRVTGTHEPVP